MSYKLRMRTCSEEELSVAEFGLRAQGLQLVEYDEGKNLLPGKEYMKRPLGGFETGLAAEKHWALIWCSESEQ